MPTPEQMEPILAEDADAGEISSTTSIDEIDKKGQGLKAKLKNMLPGLDA